MIACSKINARIEIMRLASLQSFAKHLAVERQARAVVGFDTELVGAWLGHAQRAGEARAELAIRHDRLLAGPGQQHERRDLSKLRLALPILVAVVGAEQALLWPESEERRVGEEWRSRVGA